MASSSSSNVGSAFDNVEKVAAPISSYTDELARELDRYRELGQTEAAQHRPTSDARTLDTHETQLQTSAHKYLAVQRNFLDFELKKAVKALNALEQRLIQWRAKCEMALAERGFQMAIDAELAGDRERLIALTEKRMRSDVALRSFRVNQRIPLEQPATYPESLYWHFGVVAALGLLETLANAVFYQNDQGLLGGVIIAFSVSVLNLGLAITLGWAFRYRHLREPDQRAAGWLAFVLFVTWTLFSNALFASFRSEYQAINPDNTAALTGAFTKSMQNATGIFTMHLHLTDLQSFILFGLGLLLSLLAFWKGLTSDDRYPGHRALDKASKADRAAERQALDEVGAKLHAFLRAKQTEMQSLLAEPPLIIAQVVAHSSELSQAGALYEAWQHAISRDFEMVLTTYRQANVAIRATDPPQYFSMIPDLPLSDTGPIFVQTMTDLTRIKSEASDLRQQFEAPVQEKVHQLLADSRGAIAQGLSTFRDDIFAEAQERINRELHTVERVAQ